MFKKTKEIPVYLFTGFLEAGKTRLIQESMEDPKFNKGEKTLILCCEEGKEEFDLSTYPSKNVYLETVDSAEKLTLEYLTALGEKHKVERVMVEYNGMWMLDALYNALPDGWLVYQEMMLADATTFQNYNANMRTHVVDKLQSCEMIVFNRCTEATDHEALHKIVRGVTRKAAIGFEDVDGNFREDTIEDPLPYDISAPVIQIEDRDYAIFYRDLAEEMPKYEGQTVSFLGMIGREKSLPDTLCAIGRMVMVCCEADITYRGLALKAEKALPLNTRDWARVTARVSVEYNKLYRGKGPVLTLISWEPASKPAEEVATFY